MTYSSFERISVPMGVPWVSASALADDYCLKMKSSFLLFLYI